MLPTPRLSSRINSRRAASSDTSRIARRVPSPLLATSSNKGSIMQVHRHPAANRNPQLPELCSRRAGSPSKIPWRSGQTSFLTLTESEASSLVRTPDVEAKSVDAQYPIPPASADIEHELALAKGQEGRTMPTQHPQGTETRDPALPLAQQPSRRPASTGLTSFYRVENDSPKDGAGAPVPTRKKSAALTSSVSGKENRRPLARTRVPVPPVASPPTIPPRSTRRPTVTQPPRDVARSYSLRPLVVKKWPSKSLTAGPPPQGDSSQVRSAPGTPGDVQTGIRTLMGDIDRFAKEWTEMFIDLSTDSDRREDELPQLDASPTRIHPIVRPGGTSALHTASSAAGKQTPDLLMPASSDSAAVSRSQTSTLASGDGELIQFDVTPASLARWQHRDKTMVKDAPIEEKLKPDLPEVDSASASDPPSDGAHQRSQNVVTQNPSFLMTHQAPRYLSPLPEMNQSSVISGSHLVETTSVAFSRELPEMKEHDIDTPRRSGTTHNARYYHPAAMPSVSSPLSTIAPLGSISVVKSPSPWVNLRGPDFGTPRPMRSASDVTPTRSSSLRSLRAIFKRTSTDGQRQRAESLKELIGEPRVLSLGSISISNLRDAGVASGGTMTTGVLNRKETVRW